MRVNFSLLCVIFFPSLVSCEWTCSLFPSFVSGLFSLCDFLELTPPLVAPTRSNPNVISIPVVNGLLVSLLGRQQTGVSSKQDRLNKYVKRIRGPYVG